MGKKKDPCKEDVARRRRHPQPPLQPGQNSILRMQVVYDSHTKSSNSDFSFSFVGGRVNDTCFYAAGGASPVILQEVVHPRLYMHMSDLLHLKKDMC